MQLKSCDFLLLLIIRAHLIACYEKALKDNGNHMISYTKPRSRRAQCDSGGINNLYPLYVGNPYPPQMSKL